MSGMDDADVMLADRAAATEIPELKQAWINERGTPEIMFYDKDLINVIRDNVKEQQRVLLTHVGSTSDEEFRCILFQIEIDRTNFLLNEYHRTRLKKIERHAIYIMMTSEMMDRLSEQELIFVQGYVDLLEKHMNNSFLDNIPARFQSLHVQQDNINMVEEADLNEFVFLQAKTNIGNFQLSTEGEELSLQKDDIVVSAYRPFRGLLAEGKVKLI